MLTSLRHLAVAPAVATSLLVAACASVPPPNDAMAGAELAVQQAETADAAIHAPAEFLRARTKLDTAKAELADEHYSKARRLADESRADAELAIARSRASVAEATNRDAAATLDALRAEAAPAPIVSAPVAGTPSPTMPSQGGLR